MKRLILLHGCLWAPAAAKAISAGRHTSFIVSSPDEVLGMGLNNYGQVGVDDDSPTINVPTPVDLPDGVSIAKVAAGGAHTLYLTSAGQVYAAGRNNHGQLGFDPADAAMADFPVRIAGLNDVTDVAVGYAHSIFLLNGGSVRVAGQNSAGQLGLGEGVRSTTEPTALNIPYAEIKGIAAGYDFSYFLTTNGTVLATGQNLCGQLGDGTQRSKFGPVAVKLSGKAASGIAAGESHGLFLLEDQIVGVGASFDQQLGSLESCISDPVNIVGIPETSGAGMVAAGGDSSCYTIGPVDEKPDSMLCLGSNRDGQLGLGTDVVTTEIPTGVGLEGRQPSYVSMGTTHTLVIASSDTVFGAGSNTHGQLGLDGEGVSEFKELRTIVTSTPAPTTTTTTTTTVTGGESGTTTGSESTSTEEVSETTTTSVTSGFGAPGDTTPFIWLGSVVLVALFLLLLTMIPSGGFGGYAEEAPEPLPQTSDEIELARAQSGV